MAGLADIFDEVGEDLRAERARQLALRYGGWLLLLVVLCIAAVGGWQAWRWQQTRKTEVVATQFLAAERDAGTPVPALAPSSPARAEAADAFARIAADAPDGYRSVSRLQAAALKAQAGDLPAALALWDQLAADTAAEPLLRDLASLLWAQHQIDAGDAAAIAARLQPLTVAGNPWRALAEETDALVKLRVGQADAAREILRRLAADATAPEGVRGRANGLLAQMGEPPATDAKGRAG
jgi:hypothetical protein